MAFPSFSFFENKKILLLAHAGADIDSIASAGALYFSLKNKKNACIGVPDHINQSAAAFAKNMHIPFKINPSFEGFDFILAFDFCGLEMAGTQKEKIKNFGGEIFVFDHHKKTNNPVAWQKNSLIEEKAVSATEVVYSWLAKSRVKLNKKSAACIACGVIVDSAGFHVADHNTFRIMAKVVEKSKLSFSGLVSLFEVSRDISEKIAKLKAARRVRIFKSFDNLIAFSNVGSFESSSAMSLVFLGAGIAFVGSGQGGKILVSARAKNSVIEKTGFDLVKHVFVPLQEKFGGSGGGHCGAAAFNCEGKNLEKILLECVALSHAFFESHYGKKSPLKEYD